MMSLPTHPTFRLRTIAGTSLAIAGFIAAVYSPFSTVFAQQASDILASPVARPRTPVFVPLATPSPVAAGVGKISIGVTPSVEVNGKAGDTLQTQVSVRNSSGTTQVFKSRAADFVVKDDGKTPIEVTEQVSGRWSAASWIDLVPNENISIPPGGKAVFTVIIKVPENALPGGHYAMILHQPTDEAAGPSRKISNKENDSASAITPRAGTLLYIKIAGDVHEEAFVRDFKAPKWLEFGPVPFTYGVENQSDIHISPKANIVVKDIFGQQMVNLSPESRNIFPYTSRSFEEKWSTLWGFGPYTANLTVGYGETGKIVTATTHFWIIPYRVILAILVILMSILAVIIAIRRHLHHRGNVHVKTIELLEERIRELERRQQQ